MINFDLRGILHTQTSFISFQTLTKSQPCVYLCHKVLRSYKAVLYTKCLNNFHKFYNIEGQNILHNILTKKLNRTKQLSLSCIFAWIIYVHFIIVDLIFNNFYYIDCIYFILKEESYDRVECHFNGKFINAYFDKS